MSAALERLVRFPNVQVIVTIGRWPGLILDNRRARTAWQDAAAFERERQNMQR